MPACPGSFPAFAVADSVGLLARRNFAARPSRPGMQGSGSRGISPALQSRGGDGFSPSFRHGVCNVAPTFPVGICAAARCHRERRRYNFIT